MSTWHRILVALIIVCLLIFGFFKLVNYIYPGFNFRETPPKIRNEYKVKEKAFLKELFKGCNWFADKGVSIRACNYRDPSVRNEAAKLAGAHPGELNIGQVCEIYDFLRNNWKYINDSPNREYYATASETIQNGFHGDCDDFAIVLSAMLSSIGAESRFSYASNKDNGHAFSEINIGFYDPNVVQFIVDRYYFETDINYREDKHGLWLNLDWFAHHPGGPYFEYDRGVAYYPLDDYCENFKR